MSVFDADAEEEALAPPVLKVGGRTYVGRVLSRDELRPMAVIFAKTDRDDLEQYQAEVQLLRMVYRNRWWQFWKPDPVKQVLRLTPATLQKFREDFFAFLARMVTPNLSRTNGTSSRPSTVVAEQRIAPRAGSPGV